MTAVEIPATGITFARTTTRAGAVRGWIVGGSVYSAAVLNRSSLGVASIAALHRFGISPAQLSIFVILQLGIYSAMQIPTGLLVDAFGSRRLLLAASTLIAIAGLLFAFAPNYPTALFARGLLGCGDAMTYISVLRFASTNFSPRRFPHVIALTGAFGFVATLVGTVPLALLLHAAGWHVTFTVAALVPALSGLAVWFAMPAAEATGPDRTNAKAMAIAARTAWRTAGTRLGFWLHFSCMSTATIFAMLWGLPYLVAIGFSKSAGSELLLMCVIVSVVFGFSVGALTASRPILRVPIAVVSCVATIVGWVLLLAIGGDHPSKTIVTVLVAVMAVGPPVSGIAFMLARDYNRPEIGGTATGVVNGAGFLAAITCAAAIGAVLEFAGSGPGAFRLALGAAIAIQAYGTVRMLVWWRRVRVDVLQRQVDGRPVPITLVAHRWDGSSSWVNSSSRAPRRGNPLRSGTISR